MAKAKTKKAVKTREWDASTGFTVGSQSQFIAKELIKGGGSKREISERIRAALPKKTEFGNLNPIDQKIHAVLSKLLSNGATVESTYRIVLPKGGPQAAPSKPPGRTRKASKKVAKKAAKKASGKPRKTATKAAKKAATTRARKRPTSRATKATKRKSVRKTAVKKARKPARKTRSSRRTAA